MNEYFDMINNQTDILIKKSEELVFNVQFDGKGENRKPKYGWFAGCQSRQFHTAAVLCARMEPARRRKPPAKDGGSALDFVRYGRRSGARRAPRRENRGNRAALAKKI